MSYDLYFWRQAAHGAPSPAEVMASLNDGRRPAGVESIPTPAVLSRLREEFPEIQENHTQNPERPLQLFWEDVAGRAIFLLDWSDYHISVEGHGVPGDVFNRIIDVLDEFGCALYDPQTGVRYSGETQ